MVTVDAAPLILEALDITRVGHGYDCGNTHQLLKILKFWNDLYSENISELIVILREHLSKIAI